MGSDDSRWLPFFAKAAGSYRELSGVAGWSSRELSGVSRSERFGMSAFSRHGATNIFYPPAGFGNVTINA